MHARILSDPGRPYGRTVQPKLRPGERCLACGLTAPEADEPPVPIMVGPKLPLRPIADGWWLDFDQQAIRAGDVLVPLTPVEYSLLEVLAASPGALCRKSTLALAVWGLELGSIPEQHAIQVNLDRVRAKVRSAGLRPEIIQTVRCRGYRLKTEGEQL